MAFVQHHVHAFVLFRGGFEEEGYASRATQNSVQCHRLFAMVQWFSALAVKIITRQNTREQGKHIAKQHRVDCQHVVQGSVLGSSKRLSTSTRQNSKNSYSREYGDGDKEQTCRNRVISKQRDKAARRGERENRDRLTGNLVPRR